MNYYEVAPTRIIRSGQDSFTYFSEYTYSVGQLVQIPVGKKVLEGIILQVVQKPPYETKSIIKTLEDTTLPKSLVRLSLWLAEYYRTPLATVLQTVLPRGLTVKRREKDTVTGAPIRARTPIVLNGEQQAAVEKITAVPPATVILQGVTGSGKTEVYKEVARRTLAAGKSVIVLVPEISLTSQVVDEFAQEFSNTIVTHSHMTEAERHTAWRRALTAPEPVVVVGPRSALFMPVPHLGFIAVDEAHEPSYKQEQAPRYSALRAATMLGKFSVLWAWWLPVLP